MGALKAARGMNERIESVRFDDGAGSTLAWWGTAGPLVLCVHGMTSSRMAWERLARHLADRFRVVAYDQRGHGDSADVRGPMTLSRAVRDLEEVATQLGETPTLLIGHSWGGAVAILAGASLPVRAVVAIDPMLRQQSALWYDEFAEELEPLFALQGAARAEFVRESFSAWSEEDRESKVHAVATMTLEPIERLRDENPPEHWNLLAVTAAYPKPLLLAMADGDASIVAAADLEAIRERHGADTDIAVFEGGDHNLHRTVFDRFVPVLDQFIATKV